MNYIEVNAYDRKEVVPALTQMKREGYVPLSFKLTQKTCVLADMYYDACYAKAKHEAHLMEQTAACKEAFETRQAAQAELDRYIEDQNITEEDLTTEYDGGNFEQTCDVLTGWHGCRSDVVDRTACKVYFNEQDNSIKECPLGYGNSIAYKEEEVWYNTIAERVEVYDSWQESCIFTSLTCDILYKWYSEYCHIDPDNSYNYLAHPRGICRIIKDQLPKPAPLNILRKLRALA